jgi:CheY-like chemotaxis protein
MRILVVDDHRDSAESLALLLRRRSFEVDVAFDGLEAVEAAQKLRPDVVLLDLRLPSLDGFDACRRIRQQARGRKIFLIAHTGLTDRDDERRMEEVGFDAHLVKPLDHAALQQLLSDLTKAEGQGFAREETS